MDVFPLFANREQTIGTDRNPEIPAATLCLQMRHQANRYITADALATNPYIVPQFILTCSGPGCYQGLHWPELETDLYDLNSSFSLNSDNPAKSYQVWVYQESHSKREGKKKSHLRYSNIFMKFQKKKKKQFKEEKVSEQNTYEGSKMFRLCFWKFLFFILYPYQNLSLRVQSENRAWEGQ